MKLFLRALLNLLFISMMASVAYTAGEADLAETKIKEAKRKIAIKEYDDALSLTNEARRIMDEYYARQETKYLEDKNKSLQNELKYGRRTYDVETYSLMILSGVQQLRYLILLEICDNYIEIAAGYLSNQQLDKTKILYREIVTSFDANKYRSCVKKAEFGLEDLRALEAKMEKERLEKEQQAEKERLEKERLEQEEAARQKLEEEKKLQSSKKKRGK